ncbi:MAG: FtsQ-type POTRA domain-containing protein [Clostridiales Family XIII bacterium]|jgi:cell division protein FtsQ|nr:FtsQ-type POTRA domain-containing protein [Clostridiales Family XIII bacterium]
MKKYYDEPEERYDEYGAYEADAYYDDYGGPAEPPKRRRKKHHFLRFLIFIAVLAGLYLFAASEFFAIDTIDVTGNSRYTAEQVEEMSGITSGGNLFKTRMSKAEKRIAEDPYIKSVSIKRKLPRTVVITVKERIDGFCVLFDEKYYLLDSEGVVLSASDTPPNVTLVEGLAVTEAAQGQKISVEKNLLLADTIRFLDVIRSNGLYFKRVEASDLTARAYLDEQLLCEGTFALIEKDIAELKLIIADLHERKVKKGTIIMSGSGSCTFSPQVKQAEN